MPDGGHIWYGHCENGGTTVDEHLHRRRRWSYAV